MHARRGTSSKTRRPINGTVLFLVTMFPLLLTVLFEENCKDKDGRKLFTMRSISSQSILAGVATQFLSSICKDFCDRASISNDPKSTIFICTIFICSVLQLLAIVFTEVSADKFAVVTRTNQRLKIHPWKSCLSQQESRDLFTPSHDLVPVDALSVDVQRRRPAGTGFLTSSRNAG